MLEHVADGVGVGGRIQRDADMPGHPDRQVGDDPVGGVLAEDADGGLRRQGQGLQVRGHAPRLLADLAPAVVDDRAVRQGLGQVDGVGRTALPVEETVQQRRVLIVLVHGRSCVWRVVFHPLKFYVRGALRGGRSPRRFTRADRRWSPPYHPRPSGAAGRCAHRRPGVGRHCRAGAAPARCIAPVRSPPAPGPAKAGRRRD
ncbi:hypothetical protein D3C84_519040 [compost metagenome]